MTKKEQKRFEECKKSRCKFFIHCLQFWGKECIHQQGKKIPRLHFGVWKIIIEPDGNYKMLPR